MNIYEYFQRSARLWPDRGCVYADKQTHSYREMSLGASRIAATIDTTVQFVGVFAYRSKTAYAAILGILQAGKAYVPLNPKFPSDRNRQIIQLAGPDVIVVGRECLAAAEESLRELGSTLTLIFPDAAKSDISSSLLSDHTCLFPASVPDYREVFDIEEDSPAYMLFTSGSTGVPKGVPISHGNVTAYVDYLAGRYDIKETDRFSHTFDLTFDLSVHDMFLCWRGGACMYVIPESVLIAPARFIQDHELTLWFSVPTLIQFMARFRMLKTGVFSSLRYSLFCGEPMPLALAQKWQEAAPESVVENIYGPTEATIGITHYRFNKQPKANNGILSIGKVFSTQHYLILGEDGKKAGKGETGELLLSGNQLSSGYWNDEEKTKEQFVTFRGRKGRWYRTGDLVFEDGEGDLFFVGRKDFQVKVRGYRIELDEVSHAIGGFLGSETVVSVPWPVVNGVAESIYSFVDLSFRGREEEIIAHLGSCLPEYMVPAGIRFIEYFPLTSNGKVDRKALASMLEEESDLNWTSI